MASKTVEMLREFVEKADKLGKYPSNTANARIAALKVIENGLTTDEPDTIEYIAEHIDEIFHRQLDKLNLSSGSLQTYISRVRSALKDYRSHGQDSKTFLSWKPKTVVRQGKIRTEPTPKETSSLSAPLTQSQSAVNAAGIKLRTVSWSLRPDLIIQMQVPIDFNKNDAKRLVKLIELETELASTPS